MAKFYLVPDKLFEALVYDYVYISMLDHGGVDNWIGYEDAYKDYINYYINKNPKVKELLSLEEIAEYKIQELIDKGIIEKYLDREIER